ncbi:unnamed protein product [Notodromas monacha]|uniref:Uncharacterized protein n=1 Tax=Notodromas monacha TaxID=399045 RepID=A0A7R9BKE4_9CRUS|nr:unnamed protein product [Notodromas monacha]CAG0917109.1 unnamed protein product [Notodromas monacha]
MGQLTKAERVSLTRDDEDGCDLFLGLVYGFQPPSPGAMGYDRGTRPTTRPYFSESLPPALLHDRGGIFIRSDEGRLLVLTRQRSEHRRRFSERNEGQLLVLTRQGSEHRRRFSERSDFFFDCKSRGISKVSIEQLTSDVCDMTHHAMLAVGGGLVYRVEKEGLKPGHCWPHTFVGKFSNLLLQTRVLTSLENFSARKFSKTCPQDLGSSDIVWTTRKPYRSLAVRAS